VHKRAYTNSAESSPKLNTLFNILLDNILLFVGDFPHANGVLQAFQIQFYIYLLSPQFMLCVPPISFCLNL